MVLYFFFFKTRFFKFCILELLIFIETYFDHSRKRPDPYKLVNEFYAKIFTKFQNNSYENYYFDEL